MSTHDLGRVVCNDSGCITTRRPDSVRGPDLSFYRHDQIPPKPFGPGYWNAVPPLVCEVLSPHDRLADVQDKIEEYLRAGVQAICLFDPQAEVVRVFRPGQAPKLLRGDEALTLPEVFGDAFSVLVKRFFA